jgi:hemerythrin-like domain-containing protein
MTYSLAQALTELLAQHDEIRRMLHRCETLADELDAGKLEPEDLLREVARLRVAFEVHNKFEEQLLRPILREADAFGEVRVAHMVDDHVGEHRAMHARLGTEVTTELRGTIAKLREHLAAEERYFLSPKVMRDDLVVVEGGG